MGILIAAAATQTIVMYASNDARGPAERRRYPRIRAKVPVELLPLGAGGPMRTATDEISLCGCYIESMFTMDIGTKLQLTFSLNERSVQPHL